MAESINRVVDVVHVAEVVNESELQMSSAPAKRAH